MGEISFSNPKQNTESFHRLSSGSYGSIVSIPVIETGEPGDTNYDLGRRIGLLTMFLATGGLLGPPISGIVFRELGVGSMGIYAGMHVLESTHILLTRIRNRMHDNTGRFDNVYSKISRS